MMIRLFSIAALAMFGFAWPAAAVSLEYSCAFNEQVAGSFIYGGYRVGPDGEIRDRTGGWRFDSGPAVEDMEIDGDLTWRDGTFELKSITVSQNVVQLPKVATRVRISLPSGPTVEDRFITLERIRGMRGGPYAGYGKGVWIGAPAFLAAVWESERMDVVITEEGGAEVLRTSYALPARETREALSVRFAELDSWVAKRDFSRCTEYDLDEEPDLSAVI